LLGVISLSFLILGIFLPAVNMTLGRGGAERIVAYPVLIWVVAFGGYLMGSSNGLKKAK
jgi:hypothetical protein